jgi:7-carboxy-7-deazaguanine synthase
MNNQFVSQPTLSEEELQNKSDRPLSELAVSEISARSHGAQNRSGQQVHEDSSNVTTQQLSNEVALPKRSIRITEIFYSLQGESTNIGLPTVFVRLTGCPLRCQYCDTSYAFKGGKRQSIDAIINQISEYQCPQVCVTGGEPLAQTDCHSLLTTLCDQGYRVSLETSGALDITNVDPRVMIVMDLKTPDSNERAKNLLSNINHLKPRDQIKFVICSRQDYEWSKQMIHAHQLSERVELLLSPSWEQLEPSVLANWIIEDRLPVRFQIQLHKILWHDARGR